MALTFKTNIAKIHKVGTIFKTQKRPGISPGYIFTVSNP